MYIRIARTNVPDVFDRGTYKFDPLKAHIIHAGTDITLITNGETLAEAMDCLELLKEQGISAELIHMPVIKPIDKDAIIKSAMKTRKIVTIENHSIIGGLGSAVCEVLSENYPTQVLRIGTNDVFGQSGEQRELMDFYGLTGEKLFQRVIKFLGKQ